MKRTVTFVLGFACLGALTGACMPLFVERRDSMSYGLPYWLDVSPPVAVLLLSIPYSLFLGALTGLASAFAGGRFATVRCLLAITIPALLAMAVFAPPHLKAEFAKRSIWMQDAVGAAVAIGMAVLLAYLGHRRTRRTSPTPHAR